MAYTSTPITQTHTHSLSLCPHRTSVWLEVTRQYFKKKNKKASLKMCSTCTCVSRTCWATTFLLDLVFGDSNRACGQLRLSTGSVHFYYYTNKQPKKKKRKPLCFFFFLFLNASQCIIWSQSIHYWDSFRIASDGVLCNAEDCSGSFLSNKIWQLNFFFFFVIACIFYIKSCMCVQIIG